MRAAIADKREELVELRTGHGVARLDMSGAAARETDFDPPGSDAGFLAGFTRADDRGRSGRRFHLAGALRRAPGRSMDPAEAAAVGEPCLRAAIDNARALIYARCHRPQPRPGLDP